MLGKNTSSMKNITIFTPENHPTNIKLRATQGTRKKNHDYCLMTTREYHYVKFCTTHSNTLKPFEPKYTHAL